jgi:hypothetical protein
MMLMKLNVQRFIPILVRLLPFFIRLLPIFIRVFPIFERFVPVFFSYFLEGSLRPLKAKGSIDDYRSRTIRIGKCHYRIDIRIVMTSEQAKTVLNDVLSSTLRMLRGSIGGLGGIMATKDNGSLGDKMLINDAKIERVDAEIDEISQRILLELESASSKDLKDVRYAKMMLHLSDIHYAKRVLQQIGSVTKQSSGAESEIEKRAVIKVLLFSTWLQRLYFIIRSFLMGLISSAATFLLILSVGTINAITGAFFGIIVFVFSLVITRLFDVQITKGTKKIIEMMAGHRTVRDFIMNHF